MGKRSIQWINTPVLTEAIMRYEEGRLSRPLKLWIEQLLELDQNKSAMLLTSYPHN